MIDCRRFFRVIFSTPAQLCQGETVLVHPPAGLILARRAAEEPDGWPTDTEGRFELSFALGGSDIEIRMEVEPSHMGQQRLGLYCHHIDIDSASHLKRLIELNVGNAEAVAELLCI